jgi:maltooligosyltrehalose trehalohydrolase
LSSLVDFENLKLAAACVLLSPFTPLLFMGEEYGETAPFQYMVDHSDQELLQAIRNGRREEFASFAWSGEVPDPASEATFVRSRLNHSLREKGNHQKLLQFYRKLLALRKEYSCIRTAERRDMEVKVEDECLFVRYRIEPELHLIFSFANEPITPRFDDSDDWETILDSASIKWGGSTGQSAAIIAPRSARVLRRRAHSVT